MAAFCKLYSLLSTYLTEKRQHVVKFVLQFTLGGSSSWVPEVSEEFAQMHKPQGVVRTGCTAVCTGIGGTPSPMTHNLAHKVHGKLIGGQCTLG